MSVEIIDLAKQTHERIIDGRIAVNSQFRNLINAVDMMSNDELQLFQARLHEYAKNAQTARRQLFALNVCTALEGFIR